MASKKSPQKIVRGIRKQGKNVSKMPTGIVKGMRQGKTPKKSYEEAHKKLRAAHSKRTKASKK